MLVSLLHGLLDQRGTPTSTVDIGDLSDGQGGCLLKLIIVAHSELIHNVRSSCCYPLGGRRRLELRLELGKHPVNELSHNGLLLSSWGC